jgi:hypothetical protein
MRYQARKFTCGPASICNALSAYGTYVKEEDACETSPNGTDSKAIVAGIRKHGRAAEEFKSRDSLVAITWLDTSIRLGAPVILCVDAWTHWVACIGSIGDRYLVADSAHMELIVPYTSLELVDRWKHDKRFYGIGVV